MLGVIAACVAKPTHSPEAALKGAVISGIARGFTNAILHASFYQDAFENNTSCNTEKEYVVSNEKFSVASPFTDRPSHVTLMIRVADGDYTGIIGDFLVEPGDQVQLVREGNGHVGFSGKDAAKFICQYEIIHLPPFKGYRMNIAADNEYEMFTRAQHFTDSILNLKLAIIEKWRSKLSNRFYDILRYDRITEVYAYRLTNFIAFITNHRADNKKIYALQWYNESLQSLGHNLTSTQGLLQSVAGISFIYHKAIADIIATHVTNGYQNASPSEKEVYDYLSDNFSGTIREKLLTQAIIYRFNNSDSSFLFSQKLVAQVHTPAYRSIIKKLQRKLTGSTIPDFVFTNPEGKTVQLSNFKDKTVLIDFWFWGCGACRVIADSIKEVIHTYKNDSNLVFLSVNVDKNKEDWLDHRDKYSPKGSIEVYTSGLGYTHPVVQYYDFDGYPQLILMGKNRELLTITPDKDPGKSEFDEVYEILRATVKK